MPTVTVIRPFRGTLPFEDSEIDRAFFAGRDDEADQLASQIIASPLVVLFGRSGLGKTSLINAGLLGRLRARRYFPIVARLSWSPAGNTHALTGATELLTHDISASVIAQVRAAAKKFEVSSTTTTLHDPSAKMGGEYSEDLWSFFVFSRFVESGTPVRPVLIIDQFEELFSRFDRQAREKFIEQFSNLVSNRAPEALRRDAERRCDTDLPDEERENLSRLAFGELGHDGKVLIVIREDYLPQLEELKSASPNIFRTTFRLLPLTRAQAREAIVVPPRRVEKFGGQPFSFDDDAVEEILEFLSTENVAGRKLVADAIEPLQLQILCADLDRRRRVRLGKGIFRRGSGKRNISKSDLGGRKGMQRVIADYYDRVIRTLPRIRSGWNGRRARASMTNLIVVNFPRATARDVCEMQLITPQGQRNSLPGDFIVNNFGLTLNDLQQLVNSYLLRSEPRLNAFYYELSHDSLAGILITHRRRRQWRRRFALFVAANALAVSVATAVYTPTYNLYVWIMLPRYNQIANSKYESSEQRANSIRWLLAHTTEPLDLSGTALENVDLSTVDAYRTRFNGARLQVVKFDGSVLVNSDFRNSIIEGSSFGNTSFRKANLLAARFDRAEIRAADFTDADLTLGSFSNASLNDVDFSGAEFSAASFRNASFDAARLNLSGSSWWLATGWNLSQVENLAKRFPREQYTKSNAFERASRELQSRADSSAGIGSAGASAYNSLAWWLATCGVNLDEAETHARKALDIINMLGDEDASHRDLRKPLGKPNIQDTLAYILMQRGVLLSEASTIMAEVITSTGDAVDGGWYFRYSWILDKLGKKDEAKAAMKMAVVDKNYVPSHELVLLPGMLEQYRSFIAELKK